MVRELPTEPFWRTWPRIQTQVCAVEMSYAFFVALVTDSYGKYKHHPQVWRRVCGDVARCCGQRRRAAQDHHPNMQCRRKVLFSLWLVTKFREAVRQAHGKTSKIHETDIARKSTIGQVVDRFLETKEDDFLMNSLRQLLREPFASWKRKTRLSTKSLITHDRCSFGIVEGGPLRQE